MRREDISLGVLMATAHRTFGDTLLPLAHSDAFLQGGAFLQQQVPTTVGVSGPDAGPAGGTSGSAFSQDRDPCAVTLHKMELGWEIEKEAKTWKKSGDGCWEIKRTQKRKKWER